MENQQSNQRLTAKICSIQELLSGIYVVSEGWKPNFIQTQQGRQLAKINIMGFITQKPSPYNLLVDDATGSILVIDFNNLKKTALLKVGDPVLIIGRPRKSEETLFISADIITSSQLKKTPKWLSYRKAQLKEVSLQDFSSEITSEILEDEDEDSQDITLSSSSSVSSDDILSFIRKKDAGDGCPVQEIISYFGDSADNIILSLSALGEIYEIRSGIVKILE
jgi:hypothetical protein